MNLTAEKFREIFNYVHRTDAVDPAEEEPGKTAVLPGDDRFRYVDVEKFVAALNRYMTKGDHKERRRR
jgi:hypothetical protein